MSNDGEITVEVSAEGTDEAADQLAGEGGDGAGGGAGPEQPLSESIRGGIVGGLLAAGLGSVLDILSPMLEVLEAFVAPFALMALRVLQPAMRALLRFLPQYLDLFQVMADNESLIDKLRAALFPLIIIRSFLASLVGAIGPTLNKIFNALTSGVSRLISMVAGLQNKIASALRGAADSIIQRLRQLPQQIGSALRRILPDFPDVPSFPSLGGGDGTAGDAVDTAAGVGQTIINIAGGVPAFIDEVTRSRRTDG